jgi:hypothetical protein
MFFTGKSADGSDLRPAHGMFINPNNPNEFSNMPYDKEQKQNLNDFNMFYDIRDKISGTYLEEAEKIKNKTSKLTRSEREFVLNQIK